MSRFSKEYKFIIVFISFVLIFAASVVFVGIKNINGAIADDDVWEELNNTVYTSDYSEIFDTDGSKLEALTKEIYGVINGLSADSKKNFLINNPTDSGADELLKK